MSAPEVSPPRGTLVVASLAVLLAAADTYVVVLALPDMMTGVGLTVEELGRAAPLISSFLLGYVAVLPLIGRVSDLRGRVPVLVVCLFVFALGSLLTAGADTLATAVVGRALQGLGGGGLVPATLALVADRWPPQRRGLPLGVVGAVQELGSVLGPLFGAAVLVWQGWRAIFWVNLAAALVLALFLWRPRRSDPVLLGLVALATSATAVAVLEPVRLATGLVSGLAFAPLAGAAPWSTPLALTALAGWSAAALRWALRTQQGGPEAGMRQGVALLREVDLLGAGLLTLALSCVVLAFATADAREQVVSDGAPGLLVVAAAAAAGFVARNRKAAHPLVPRGALAARAAWGALVVNVLVGAALVAVLVDVPLFARFTTSPDSQLGAALELVQLLAALPVGALAGGWGCRHVQARFVAASGMLLAAAGLAAMTQWDAGSLAGPGSVVVLVVTGLGFGLAIAPVNVALLAATEAGVHGLASALAVVARMVGMLVGVSALTAIGLRVFYARQAQIGSPVDLCPANPVDCPAFAAATRDAVLAELQAVFAGAAGCALLASVLALVLLRVRSGAARGRLPQTTEVL